MISVDLVIAVIGRKAAVLRELDVVGYGEPV
jgi:hypothetical protein